MQFAATVYKPCDDKCGRCKACKDFTSVLREIDLDRTSLSERQRQIIQESRKDHR